MTALLGLACSEAGEPVAPDPQSRSIAVKPLIPGVSWEKRAVREAMAMIGSTTPVRINKRDRTVSGPDSDSPPASYREAVDRTIALLADRSFGDASFDGGPEPECLLVLPGSSDDWKVWEACLDGLMNDDEFEVVAIKTINNRNPPEMHALREEDEPN